MPTMVVGQLPQCGDQGYLSADINRDCHVNLMDLAMMAQQWLACTMPGQAGCQVSEPTIVGLGMAFDDRADEPAKILYLYDDTNLNTLEAGDEIIEYRGLPITSGADLMAAIDSLPMLVQGELVPVSLIRDTQTLSVVATAATISAEGVDVSPCSGKRCVRI